MALNINELTALNDLIAHAIERHIEPIFKRGTKITVLARTPGNNEADVLVSSEGDLQDALDMVGRSMKRNVIGGPGVYRVPRMDAELASAAQPGVMQQWRDEALALAESWLMYARMNPPSDTRALYLRGLLEAHLSAVPTKE